MPLRNANPEFFVPRGLIDGYDQTMSFKGACQKLQNLIFDQSNNGVVVPRPAVLTIVDFIVTGGWSSPTNVSVFKIIGTRAFGMIGTSRNAGKDEPFCYDTATGSFVIISGVTNANTPTTPAITGKWNPPTMAMISTKIIVTHPGFPGTVGAFFGVIDLANPAAPAWSSANTSGNLLATVPIAVANYNNRAWYAVGNVMVFSDILVPATVTNASQALTIDDTAPIIGLGPLPIGTGTQGIIAALIVFKGAGTSIWQITGDSATNNLSLQQLSSNNGCSAPRTITATPEGIKFLGVDGAYYVNLLGQVLPVSNRPGEQTIDLQDPFINATEAQLSRAAGAWNQGVYRASLETTWRGQPYAGASALDFWFDEHSRRWNGPHTFPYSCAFPLFDYFVLSSTVNQAKLFQSQPTPHNSSVYSDAVTGSYSCDMLTSLMPNRGDMSMNTIQECEMELGKSAVSSQYTISAQDEFGNQLNAATITLTNSGPQWGAVVWGVFKWASSKYVSQMIPIPWTSPVIFKRLAIEVVSTANAGVAIGQFGMRYQRLGFMNARVA